MANETLPVVSPAYKTLAAELRSKRTMAALSRIASSMVKPEQFVSVALHSVNRTPKLLDCSIQSIVIALAQAAREGLPIDGMHAALVPFKREATYIRMYPGMIKLTLQSGKVTAVSAHCVYEKDEFAYQLGTDKFLRHVPYGGSDLPGDIIGSYMLVLYPNGQRDFHYLTRREIEERRNRSPAAKSKESPWSNPADFPAMCAKSAIRAGWKYLPMSPEIQAAIQYDNAIDAGRRMQFDFDDAALYDIEDETPSKAAALADKIPAPDESIPGDVPASSLENETETPVDTELQAVILQSKRDQIRAWATEMADGDMVRQGEFIQKWFKSSGPINLDVIKERAVNLAWQFGKTAYDNWQASKGDK